MIDKLEMFIALARERHFGRAAEACGVTQPTLSVAIRQLEGQLGVQLVYRGSRFGGLTPEGARALDWARRIVADARGLREEMRAARRGLSGRLRIGVIPTALATASALTMRFARAHPNVRFTVYSRTSAEILTMMESFEIDTGITYLDNEPLGHVTAVPLYAERYTLVAAPGHVLYDRSSVTWADLGAGPLCLLSPDMQNRRIIDASLAAAGVSVPPSVESNSTVVLIAHVLSGGWATILPTRLAEFHARGRKLKVLPIGGPEVEHSVGLIVPHREPHTPVLDALMAAARALSEEAER